MRPPSSGGSGNRFNAINIRLIEIPICAISSRPSLAQIPDGSAACINSAHKNDITKLANSPPHHAPSAPEPPHPPTHHKQHPPPPSFHFPHQKKNPRHQDRPDRVDMLDRI